MEIFTSRFPAETIVTTLTVKRTWKYISFSQQKVDNDQKTYRLFEYKTCKARRRASDLRLIE